MKSTVQMEDQEEFVHFSPSLFIKSKKAKHQQQTWAAMPSGRLRKYLHFNKPPEPPRDSDGNVLNWTPARLADSNPAYRTLKAGLTDGTISHHTKPHIVYNSNPAFYVIAPSKFASFFAKTVEGVLGIELAELDDGDDAISDNGDDAISEEASSQPNTTTTSKAASKSNTSTSQSSGRDPLNMSVSVSNSSSPSEVIIDDNGLVTHAPPLASFGVGGPHSQIHLFGYINEREGGCDVVIVPSASMSASSIVAFPSTEDPSILMVVNDKGPIANPVDVKRALTKGTHYIQSKNGCQDLRLEECDANVVAFVDSVKNMHGQHVQALKSQSEFMAIKLKKAIKRRLAGRNASNRTYLPPKYEIKQREVTDGRGFRVIVISVEYQDNDMHELNYEEDESPM